MYNISLERQKFYASHDFKNLDKSDDVEVSYNLVVGIKIFFAVFI